MGRKILLFSLVTVFFIVQLTLNPVSYAATSYTGNWNDQWNIGSYGFNQMDLRMKETGKKLKSMYLMITIYRLMIAEVVFLMQRGSTGVVK